MVAPHDEDDVVGGRGDAHRRQQVDGEGGQADHVRVAQQGDDPAGRGHLDSDHHQDQYDGDDGAVDQKQHDEDDHQGHGGDLVDALVAGLLLVGHQRAGSGDEDLQAGRRLGSGDDVANRLHGLVGQALALVAGQIELHVGGLAVGALRAGRRQRVAPEVLDVLDVPGVGPQCVHQPGVVVVGFTAQRRVALQHDHRRGVGVELLEGLPDLFHRLQGRSIGGGQRHRVHLTDYLELRDLGVQRHDQGQPQHQDRQREQPDHPGNRRMRADVAVGGGVLGRGGHRDARQLPSPAQPHHWPSRDLGPTTSRD